MIDLYVKDIRNALENKCYFAALSLALALPDMCGAVEFGENCCAGKRYVNWFDEYIGKDAKEAQNFGGDQQPWISGEVVYRLRNQFLHLGNAEIKKDKIKEHDNQLNNFELILGDWDLSGSLTIKVEAPIPELKETIDYRAISIDVKYLCNCICKAALDYYNVNKCNFKPVFGFTTQKELHAKAERHKMLLNQIDSLPERKENEFIVNDRRNYIYRQGEKGPIICWPYLAHDEQSISRIYDALAKADIKQDFFLILVEIKDEEWRTVLSPWPAKGIDGRSNFAGEGRIFNNDDFRWIRVNVKVSFPTFDEGTYIVGYSLAGLFALWAFYETKQFDGVAACSGSLWYEGWMKYMETASAKGNSLVYLSYGGKEQNTDNLVLKTIGECYKQQYTLAKKDKNVRNSILEINKGGHFSNPEERVVKGIKWLLENRNS